MANELDYDDGLAITLQFISANLATGAGIVDMTLAQGGTGFVVPTGYKFHALYLMVTKTGTLDADAAVVATVIDNGTELVNGPTATVTHTPDVARAAGIARVGAQPISADHVVGVSLTKDADYDTTDTIDWDAVLTGILLPA
jgi:hypothetical protein